MVMAYSSDGKLIYQSNQGENREREASDNSRYSGRLPMILCIGPPKDFPREDYTL